jgi:hypothetical protein
MQTKVVNKRFCKLPDTTYKTGMYSWDRGSGGGYGHLHLVAVQVLFSLLLFSGRIQGIAFPHRRGILANLHHQHEAFYRGNMFSPYGSLLTIVENFYCLVFLYIFDRNHRFSFRRDIHICLSFLDQNPGP